MALKAKSLFVFNLEVTALNSSLDFIGASAGPELMGTLSLGFYSPTSLADEVARVLNATDAAHVYTVTVNRSILGGTQNRMTISTDGDHFELLFSTGSRKDTTVASLIGFNAADYTGATSYSGAQTVGTALIPTYFGYSYLDDNRQAKVFGAVNVSASGLKEAVVFNIQKFVNVRFKYEAASRYLEWKNLWYWMIQQRPFDFTPEITDPDTYFQVTLEKSSNDGKGLAFMMSEMLPTFPDLYDTGQLVFRKIEADANFI